MTTQDTKVDNLIINKLTKQQYAQITPNENEIYLVEDDFNPDALSDLAYSGSFADLLNKPTTLSGYGITNAYTKTEVDNKLTSTYKAAGSASSVSNLGTLDASHEGFVYNMTADFTTTSDFVEGAGKQHYAGANVAIVNTGTSGSPVYKYDILGDFIDLSGYQLSNTAVTHTASTSVGDSTTPVYINSNGVATALSYTLAKSVPADALFTDTVYTHPTTSGNKHIPSGGSSGKILKWSADGTATWETEYSYTHPTDAGNKHIPSGGSSGQVLAYGGSSGTATWTTLTDNDTKNTAGTTNNTGTKLYLAGATSQGDNPQTYSNSNVFIDTNNRLNSAAPASSANDTTVATTKWVKDQGYTTNTGTVTSVNSVSPVNGNVTLTIPDAQIQSDWNQTNTSAKDYIKNKPTIPAGVVVDQTYDGTSTNAQSGVAIQGELSTNYQPKLVSGTNIKTLNSTSLLGSGNINVLQNTATGSYAITIGGSPTSGTSNINIGTSSSATGSSDIVIGAASSSSGNSSVVIGEGTSSSGNNSVAIGGGADAMANYSIAIGYNADVDGALSAIQLGYGTNSTANSLNIGFYNTSNTHYNWTLLNGTTGLIPDARLSSNIARTTNIPTITDTYSGTSSDGMSGKAVKSAIDTAISSVYKASGSIAFASRPTPGSSYVGNVYNITDSFTTTSDFVEGAGKTYPAGTNIVCINTSGSTYKYDVLAGFVDLSGYQPSNTAVTHTASTKVGDTNQPVYIAADGTATAISYTIATSVPSGALFTDTDTKYTAGSSNSTSKLFLVGATAQGTAASNAQAKTTYSNSAVYTQNGYLYATTPSSTQNDTTVATTKFVKDQGYTSNVGTVTSVNSVSPVNGNVSLTIPTVTDTYSSTSSNGMSGKAVASAISGKQDTLVSGTNIKTINNTSILGSGNIDTKEVFVVYYNQTTYQGVASVVTYGRVIYCIDSTEEGTFDGIKAQYVCAVGTNADIVFTGTYNNKLYTYTINSSGVWTKTITNVANQDLSNLSATGESKLISLQIIDYSE